MKFYLEDKCDFNFTFDYKNKLHFIEILINDFIVDIKSYELSMCIFKMDDIYKRTDIPVYSKSIITPDVDVKTLIDIAETCFDEYINKTDE